MKLPNEWYLQQDNRQTYLTIYQKCSKIQVEEQ